MPLTRISVLLVEDHPIVREGLGTLLANERDIEVAGEAANDRGAIKRVRRMGPAVVVMDIAMPQLNGLDHP